MRERKQYIQLGVISIGLAGFLAYGAITSRLNIITSGTLMLVTALLPIYARAVHRIYIPNLFTFSAILFIFCSVFLGQFGKLYDRWHPYDELLHFLSAVAFGYIGFVVLYIYYINNKLRLPAGLILFFAFFFSLGISALWEIIEYTIDYFLHTNMQVGSLDDTMSDLMMGGLGGMTAIVLCSLYISRYKVPVVDSVVEVVTEEIVKNNEEVTEAATNGNAPQFKKA